MRRASNVMGVTVAQVYTKHNNGTAAWLCHWLRRKWADNCSRVSLFSFQNEVISKHTSDRINSSVMYGWECCMPNPE